MARLPRIYIEKILYYVTSKSGHNENLFLNSSDYSEYVGLIDKYKRQYDFKLFSYCLMPTHLHMLIELKNNVTISNIMHDINSLYTKMYNGRYSKKGHLFQERFKSQFAEKETNLLHLIRHIHMSPKRAKMVNDAAQYPHSSFKSYIAQGSRENPDMRKEVEEVFDLLGGREDEFNRYHTDVDPKELSAITRSVHKNRILGSDKFKAKIFEEIEEAKKAIDRPKIQRRVRIVLGVFGGAVILALFVAAGNYYRHTSALKSEYDSMIAVYEKTLSTLLRQQQGARVTNKAARDYAWKISLTQKALDGAKRKRGLDAQLAKEFEGYSWRIKLTQISGAEKGSVGDDLISFKNNRVKSYSMNKNGFSTSKYSRRRAGNHTSWETMQTNSKGETISWRGEWDGKTMRGVVSRQLPDGNIRDFSFVSVGEKIKR
ncbi:transposase [Candidatus Omnitrophota bacterium]